MGSLLRLTAVPATSSSVAVVEKARTMREEPLEGETGLLWALEVDGDAATRQVLPEWVASPIEQYISYFSNEARKWEKTRHSRALQGKELTQQQQEKFTSWMTLARRKHILYDKIDHTVISKLRSNADIDKLKDRMFSLEIAVQDDLAQVKVKCANGEERDLVLLRGEGVDCDVPGCLNGVANNIAEELAAPAIDAEAGVEEADQEVNFDQQQEEHILMTGDAENSGDELQIWANSSDEEAIQEIVPTGATKVKSFSHRPAFVVLEKEGLTMVPSHKDGVFISFHKTTRSWQGFYPGSTLQMSFSFEGTTGRASSLLGRAF